MSDGVTQFAKTNWGREVEKVFVNLCQACSFDFVTVSKRLVSYAAASPDEKINTKSYVYSPDACRLHWAFLDSLSLNQKLASRKRSAPSFGDSSSALSIHSSTSRLAAPAASVRELSSHAVSEGAAASLKNSSSPAARDKKTAPTFALVSNSKAAVEVVDPSPPSKSKVNLAWVGDSAQEKNLELENAGATKTDDLEANKSHFNVNTSLLLQDIYNATATALPSIQPDSTSGDDDDEVELFEFDFVTRTQSMFSPERALQERLNEQERQSELRAQIRRDMMEPEEDEGGKEENKTQEDAVRASSVRVSAKSTEAVNARPQRIKESMIIPAFILLGVLEFNDPMTAMGQALSGAGNDIAAMSMNLSKLLQSEGSRLFSTPSVSVPPVSSSESASTTYPSTGVGTSTLYTRQSAPRRSNHPLFTTSDAELQRAAQACKAYYFPNQASKSTTSTEERQEAARAEIRAARKLESQRKEERERFKRLADVHIDSGDEDSSFGFFSKKM